MIRSSPFNTRHSEDRAEGRAKGKNKVSRRKEKPEAVFLPLLCINQIMTLKSLQGRGSGNYIPALSPGLFTRSKKGNNGIDLALKKQGENAWVIVTSQSQTKKPVPLFL